MFSKVTSRTLATAVLLLIVIYGFFRIKVRQFYSDIIYGLLDVGGVDANRVIQEMQDFAESSTDISGILGWLLYYPTYFLLHITFIFLLFKNQIRTRNYLIIGLTALVTTLVALSLVGKFLGYTLLYQVSYDAFQKLFGLPFILLFIEGGRILYNDILNESES